MSALGLQLGFYDLAPLALAGQLGLQSLVRGLLARGVGLSGLAGEDIVAAQVQPW